MAETWCVILVVILIILVIWMFWGGGRSEGFSSTSLDKIPGGLNNISIAQVVPGIYGACGTNSANQIYCTFDITAPNPPWKLVPGSLSQVNLQPNFLCGVNSSSEIYCANNDIWKNKIGEACNISSQCSSNGTLPGNMSCCNGKCAALITNPNPPAQNIYTYGQPVNGICPAPQNVQVPSVPYLPGFPFQNGATS